MKLKWVNDSVKGTKRKMDKVKIQEIADEAGLPNGELLEKAKELGFSVKAANSTISMEDAGILMDYVISGTLPKGFKKSGKIVMKSRTRPNITVINKNNEAIVEEQIVLRKQNDFSNMVKVPEMAEITGLSNSELLDKAKMTKEYSDFSTIVENSYKQVSDGEFNSLIVLLTPMNFLKSDERFVRAKLCQIDKGEIDIDLMHDRFHEADSKALEVYYDKTFIGYVRKRFNSEHIDNTEVVDEFCFDGNKLGNIEMYWDGENFKLKKKVYPSNEKRSERQHNQLEEKSYIQPKIINELDKSKEWMERFLNWADENNIDDNTIPKDIECLKSLTSLSLSAKNISELPEEIDNLVKLTDLWLGYNELSELPSQIANFKYLTRLSLSKNQLKNLPKEIINLNKLTLLSLEGNPLILTLGQKQWLKTLKENGCIVNIDKEKIDLSRISAKYSIPKDEKKKESIKKQTTVVKKVMGRTTNHLATLPMQDKISYEQNRAIEFDDGYEAWKDESTGLIWEVKRKENIYHQYAWCDEWVDHPMNPEHDR